MEKMTKRCIYTALVNFANGGTMAFDTEDAIREVTLAELAAFAQNEIDLLDKKAVKAKERAAEKALEKKNDPLKNEVATLLTDDFQTAGDILAQMDGDEELTLAKVSYRLTALVKEGVAVKDDVKVEGSDGKKKAAKGYKLA